MVWITETLCVCVCDISDEDLTSSDMALKGMEPTTQEAPDSKLSLFYGYGGKGVHSALLEIKPPAWSTEALFKTGPSGFPMLYCCCVKPFKWSNLA